MGLLTASQKAVCLSHFGPLIDCLGDILSGEWGRKSDYVLTLGMATIAY